MEIKFIKGENDIKKTYTVIKQLFTTLSFDNFLNSYREKKKYGYKLIKLEVDGKIIALAGIKKYQQFYCGKL
jgi:hypothetical protein